MHLESLLLTTSVVFPIMVSYVFAARYLERRRGTAGRFGLIRRRWLAQRITGTRLRWIKCDELKRLLNADPELMVFRLLEDEPATPWLKMFESEIGLTLPQLEEALPWMPPGTRFAIYREDGIAPELAQRLSDITGGRHVLLLAGKLAPTAGGLDCFSPMG